MNLITKFTHLKYFKLIRKFNFSALSRTNSGSSVESFSTPLKFMDTDRSTGDYIVRMSPEDFNRFSSNRTKSDPIHK